MKSNKNKNTAGYPNIAKISAIAIIAFLSAVSIIRIMDRGEFIKDAVPIGVCTAGVLVLLIFLFFLIKNPNFLALAVPLILLVFHTILMAFYAWGEGNTDFIWEKWDFPYYFFVCLCFCIIACLYHNFYMTLSYSLVQIILTGIIVFASVHASGTDVSLLIILISWIISVLGVIFLLLTTKTSALTLNSAAADQNSFKNFMTTTASYIAMVDESNRVIYATKPLAQFAQTGSADLVQGRPLIDLFPGRGLKLLVCKMLQQKKRYEDDWVFSLKGQKRYFKVFSTGRSGHGSGTVINMHDMTHLAERDEIALMRDNLEIGLFFMNRNYIIQDQYSRFLEEMLSEKNLFGQSLLDVLSASFTAKELDGIKDYFDMVFAGSFDQSTLKDMNPLNEWTYMCRKINRKKIFHCDFATIERSHGEVFTLVTIYDNTAETELRRRLMEEETKQQEEMRSIYELIQIDIKVFNDFLDDAEYEFNRINKTLKNENLSAHEVLVEVYQSVHAVKSNAVILGLNTFGNKAHALELKIKKLREWEGEVPFYEMLQLATDIETLSLEKDGFKTTIDKIGVLKSTGSEGKNQAEYVLVESLSKTAARASEDMEKKVQFIVDGIDTKAIDTGPRRIIKEVLMQFIRNSVVHGIESPEERIALGKNETGTINLSIKCEGENIHVKLGDDGRGINFEKIRKKAESLNMIKKEDKHDKSALLKAMFSPGFSTAETEGIHAGRGIGLDLVQSRVNEGNGYIKVQTEKGKGTVFNIIFPREITDANAVDKSSGPILVDSD